MDAGRESPALYRFGFLVSATPHAIRSRPSDRWRLETVGGLEILLHDETELCHVTTPAGSATVLGPVFAIGAADLNGVLIQLIDADEVKLAETLSALSGRFCLILRNSAGLRAFTDPVGSRSVFYSLSDRMCLASHAELLANHLGATRSEQAKEFTHTTKYQSLSVRYLPGDMTMWDGIVTLTANVCFVFGATRVQRYWPTRELKECGIDEFQARCETFFLGLTLGIAHRPVFVGVTGGIDTRLLLAGLTRFGVAARGMTWLGNYHDVHERPIIESVVARMNLENVYIEVPGPADETALTSGRNSGGYRGRSRLTSAIRAGLGDIDAAVFLRGYGGEVIRGFYNLLERPIRAASPEEFSRVYRQKCMVKDPDPVFDGVVEAAFRSWAERVGYDAVASLGYDINDLFYWEHRMGVWGAAMHNEMDAAMLAMTGLNDRVLFELAYGLPRGVRLKKTLFQNLVEVLEPRLANLPFA